MLELLDRQQKLTANQWKIALAATLGDMLDFFDFFLIGFVLAFIVNDWNLTYGQSGMILLASGISAPFGSLVYGWLADKIGRRKVMIATVLNFSLATGAMALTPHGAWFYLVVCRFIVGLGVTGLYSVDITLVQEFVPTAKRGWLTGLTTTMLPAGVLLGAFLGGYRNALYRLARTVRDRTAARGADALHPCLGAGIAALADAHGTARGGASLDRLGVAGRSRIDPAAHRHAGRRAHPLGRAVQISAQPHRRMPHRPDADRRGRAWPVDGDAVRDGAAGLPGRGVEAGDMGQHRGDRRPLLLLVDLRRDGPPRLRRADAAWSPHCSCRSPAI